MKIMSIHRIFAVLSIATALFLSCQKEEMVKLEPGLTTLQITEVTDNSANISGYIIAEGDGFTERGVCWDTIAAPTIEGQSIKVAPDENSVFTIKIEGLDYTTKYYVRTFATKADGSVLYSQDTSFTTKVALPIVSVDFATNITQFTADVAGEVTDLGGDTLLAYGIVWSVNPDPTVNGENCFKTTNGTGLGGAFVGNLTNLLGGKSYYYRAYAKNSAGTAYSETIISDVPRKITFQTLPSAPYVTTGTTQGFATSANVSGEVTHDGGLAITQRGVCYSTSANPTIADSRVTSAGTVGTFQVTLTGLSSNTTYHVRAYATNSYGTTYGDDKTFATYPPALYMVGDGIIDAPNEWNWTVDLPMIPVNGTPNLFWKIIWMDGSGGFKINSAKAWDGNQFGATIQTVSPDGIYDIGGENVAVPATAGYYMVVVDLATRKISVATPQVYGMGNAFGGWNVQTAANLFTVDNANSVITITKTFSAGDLRMYASHPWFNTGDWWRSEINIVGTTIVFRGNGGDPASYPITAGTHTIDLNFKTGIGTMTP